MRLTRALLAVACALPMMAGPIAQSPAPSGQGPPAFRTATRLVQVNVVAHDKDGRVVADLVRGDFKLYEDGKEQPIELDPAAVTLEKVDDFWEGAFDLVIAQSASDGTFVKNLDTTVSLRLAADTRDQMIREGLTVNRKIALRGGAYRCRIVVRDVATGAIGSVIIPSDRLRGAAR